MRLRIAGVVVLHGTITRQRRIISSTHEFQLKFRPFDPAVRGGSLSKTNRG